MKQKEKALEEQDGCLPGVISQISDIISLYVDTMECVDIMERGWYTKRGIRSSSDGEETQKEKK